MSSGEKLRKTGIFGGTFDPIHMGHLMIGESARESLGLERVIYIPSGCSYMKENVSTAEHRYKMTELAISGNPYFEVSDIETKRAGDTYTYETLEKLRACYPDDLFYFIVGADTIFSISSWKNPELVFQNCTLAVSVREGYDMEAINQEIDSLTKKYQANVCLFALNRIDISSTQIREKLQNRSSIRYYIPDSVIEYINKNNLYL